MSSVSGSRLHRYGRIHMSPPFALRLAFAVVASLGLSAGELLAQEPAAADSAGESAKWDVTAAHGSTRTVSFTTSEGTWMNLDVSPDGSTIVFDLLGDIYTIPIDGGEATRIAGGPAFEVQPFSLGGQRS